MALSRQAQRILNSSKASLKEESSVDIEVQLNQIASLKQQVAELTAMLENERATNKTASRKPLEDAVERHGLDPVDELVRLAASEEVTVTQKLSILKELAGYMLPKVKHTESKHTHSHEVRVFNTKFGDNVHDAVEVTPRQNQLSE